jgi:hypothetical protein
MIAMATSVNRPDTQALPKLQERNRRRTGVHEQSTQHKLCFVWNCKSVGLYAIDLIFDMVGLDLICLYFT